MNSLWDVGELSVIMDFVKMGAAVNFLSHSDYGWDAHVHTSEEALTIRRPIGSLLEDVWAVGTHTDKERRFRRRRSGQGRLP
jgi:hypothetical protein